MSNAETILEIIQRVVGSPTGIPLHSPIFDGNEAIYVQKTIESTFVSSVGEYVNQFESMLQDITGAKYVIATTNGTTALHIALLLAGVQMGDLVITQSLSFVATANAIAHAGAMPIFVDVEKSTLGMSPQALRSFLQAECELRGSVCFHRSSGKKISACVPMHSFGFPCRIVDIQKICQDWSISLVEDAAEALGSEYRGAACGTFGLLGTLSFNGNKICTAGGGGAIMTNDAALAIRAKHLTTTAKIPHRWRFEHDEIGYNFRLPNLNAALACAQLERLNQFISFKRSLAQQYQKSFELAGVEFINEPAESYSNYWLCAILLKDLKERDRCLQVTNDAGVMTRPVWEPLHTLAMFHDAPRGDLSTTDYLAERLVNIPSSVQSRYRS